VAFLNWRFGLTQMTAWRIEVAPVPDLSNVGVPPQKLSSPSQSLYMDMGMVMMPKKGGPERRHDGREHGERKCDKERRCSRPTGPLGACISHHTSSSKRSPGPLRAPIPYPDETFTIVVVVSSNTSLIACTPSSPR
jgi:hypothetical protein